MFLGSSEVSFEKQSAFAAACGDSQESDQSNDEKRYGADSISLGNKLLAEISTPAKKSGNTADAKNTGSLFDVLKHVEFSKLDPDNLEHEKEKRAVENLARQIIQSRKIPEAMTGLYNAFEVPPGVMAEKKLNEELALQGSSMEIRISDLMGPINSNAGYKVELFDKGTRLEQSRLDISHLYWVHRKEKSNAERILK